MSNALFSIVVVVQVLSALIIVGLVLLQHGKGADMGAAFGSGASGSLFGATGSSNFLSKSTGIAAAVFFASTLGLASMGSNHRTSGGAGVLDSVSTTTAPAAKPASAPASAAASAPAAPASAASVPVSAPATNQIPK